MAVVAIHAEVFPNTDLVRDRLVGLNVLMMAVPLFLLMSLQLFQERGYPLRQRLVRYGWLYGFWVGLFTLALGGWATAGSALAHGSPGRAVAYALTGGFSPYYFLVVLAWLTVVVYCFRKAPAWLLWAVLVAAVVVVALTWHHAEGKPSVYLVFVPFLPLAFVSLLVARCGPVRMRWVVAIVVASLVAAVLEWHWHVTSGYARASVIGSATAVFLLGLRITRPAPEPVRAVSDCTLGVYCIHLYFLAFFAANVATPETFWGHSYTWLAVLLWSLVAVVGIRRAMAYKVI